MKPASARFNSLVGASIAAAFVVSGAAASSESSANSPRAKFLTAGDSMPGQYIVVLDDRQFPPVMLRRASDHRAFVESLADQLAFEARASRGFVYSEALNGFSITATAVEARRLARDPRVSLVVEDTWVEAAGEVQTQLSPPSWGLDRIDQLTPVLDDSFSWVQSSAPAEVHVYVLDTGIRSTHLDFGGRVDTLNAYTAVADGNGTEDCNGHGTHMAGTIAGTEHGVAKTAILHPVRVLSCSGGGALSAVIAGVDWVTSEVIAHQHPAVANLSLQSSPSLVLDNTIRASIAAGVTYVVAAGNANLSACYYSPSRIGETITVGGSGQNDLRVSNSNYGNCVDLYAPGEAITSTYHRSDTDSIAMTGSSSAAAHVSGIAANLLAQAPFGTPAQIKAAILANAGTMVDPRSMTGYSPLAHSLIDVANDPELGNGGLSVTASCDLKTYLCSFLASALDDRFNPIRYHWDFGEGNTNSTLWPAAIHDYSNTITRAPLEVEVAAELEDGSFWIATTIIDLSTI